jgi:hypothetical protein
MHLAMLVLLSAAVKLEPHEAEHRVDVLVDGKPFTSYRFAPDQAKPILWPIRTAGGKPITRGWPLDPQPGDPQDHPHHTGLWFNHGDVAGVDFWGNSDEIRKKQPSHKVGNIVQRSFKAHGPELDATAEWVMPDGKPALREQTHYVFADGPGRRVIDRVATLTATGAAVPFGDTKEGSLGLRLVPALEHPSKKNQSATGHYRSSEGVEGEAVWGTRARWMMLTGKLQDEPVTIAILDHPKNPGAPTYWHARGYGLFAVNPFGRKDFTKGKETGSYSLEPGKPARFAYRVLILSRQATPEDVEAEWKKFAKELK